MTEVLVDAAAALGRHGDQDLGVGFDAGHFGHFLLARRNLVLTLGLDQFLIGLAGFEVVFDLGLFHQLFEREFSRAILAEQADGIGAALAAVAHHVHVAFAGILQRLQLLRGRAALAVEAEVGAVLGFRDQRHDVVQERAARLDRLVDLDQVLVVDARDHHRIDLGENAGRGQQLQTFELALGQDLGGIAALPALVLVEDPRIDLLADFRIDHVDGDRDVIDVVILDHRHQLGQRQTIGRQAELDVRRHLRDALEGFEGLGRIGQRITGAGNAEHGHLRNRRSHRQHLARGLLGRQLFADHTGARFIGAVVLAIAVIALDVARRSHRHVHAGVMVMRLFAVARVVLDLFPDFRGHVGRAGRGTATRLAAATAGTTALMIGERLLHLLADFGANGLQAGEGDDL